MKKIVSYFLALIFLVINSSAFAKDINFEASADRKKVSIGESVQLYLSFEGTQNIPSPELPEIEGFQSRYLGPSTRMSIVNGQVSSSVTHIYSLVPLKAGILKIGPFKFDYKGDTYTSNSFEVEVVKGSLSQQAGYDKDENKITESQEISDRAFLVMQAKKTKAYLNEVIPLTIKLYVDRLSIRDIQYPQFSHEGFSAGEFEQPTQYKEMLGGVNYEVIEFSTTIFGLAPGEFRLGSATLKCNLMVSSKRSGRPFGGFDDFFDSGMFEDFFTRYETYPLELKSADMPLVISDLPQDNKPESFSGAVGDFDLEANVSPAEVKVGDPVTIKMIIKGEGNLNTVNIPMLSLTKDFKVYEPQIKQENGQKIFEQIIMPMSSTIKEIPEVSFSFFDPKTSEYKTVRKGPFTITVTKPEKEEEVKIIETPQGVVAPAPKEEKLGRDIIYIKEKIGFLRKNGDFIYRNNIFLFLNLLPLFSFLTIFALDKWNKRLATDLKYARKLRAPKKAKEGIHKARNLFAKGSAKEYYDAIFQTLQDYLGDRFHLPSAGITISIIDEVLRPKAVEENILDRLKDIFRDCDMARYAASEFNKENMQESLKKLEEVIDYFQRQKV